MPQGAAWLRSDVSSGKTLLVREVDFLMIYSHPIASDLPRGSKIASDQAKRLCVPPADPPALHSLACRKLSIAHRVNLGGAGGSGVPA